MQRRLFRPTPVSKLAVSRAGAVFRLRMSLFRRLQLDFRRRRRRDAGSLSARLRGGARVVRGGDVPHRDGVEHVRRPRAQPGTQVRDLMRRGLIRRSQSNSPDYDKVKNKTN